MKKNMKKNMRRGLIMVALLLSTNFAFATEFILMATGTWNSSGRWSKDGGATAITCAPCVEGVDFPGIDDDVLLTGDFVVSIPNGFVAKASYLLLQYDAAAQIIRQGATGGARLLQISGALISYDFDLDDYASASVNLIGTNVNLEFTGSNLQANESIIQGWGTTIPLSMTQITINQTNATIPFLNESIIVQNSFVISSGRLNIGSGIELIGSGSAVLTINSGATLNSLSPIIGAAGNPNSYFPTVNLNGTLTSSSYINGQTFNAGPNSVLECNFFGTNQTQGWWYRDNAPALFNLDPASTVRFAANTTQNVYPLEYGNLFLSAQTGTQNKILTGTGNLIVNGNFTINTSNVLFTSNVNTPAEFKKNVTNNGTWSTSNDQEVRFNGTTSQLVNGNNSIVFNDIVTITNNAGLTFGRGQTFNKALEIANSTSVTLGNFNYNFNDNLIVDGSIIPGSSTSIFNGTTEISGSGSISFNNVTISGILTLPSVCNVLGNFTNNGTFNANEGTVILNGTAGTQVIAGSSLTSFYSLTANRNSRVDGIINIENLLTIGSSVTFDADGASDTGITVLLSNSIRDARVASIPGGSSITGNITVQRYLPFGSNAARVYRYLGTPVSGSTVADWQANFPITGSFTGTSTGTGLGTGQSMFIYDEPTNLYTDYPVNANTEPLVPGRGYSAFIRSTVPITFDTRGTLVQGNVGVPLSNTDGGPGLGYNLIANPYASTIDWDLVTKTGMSGAIYVRDNTNISGIGGGPGYLSYVDGVGTGGFNGNIPSSMAFWVQSTGASTLNFKEADKTSGSSIFYEAPVQINDLLRIYAEGNGRKDDIVIRFLDGATDGVDSDFDAVKFMNPSFNISSKVGDKKYAINTLSPLNCNTELGIAIENFAIGSYELTFAELNTFTNPVNIYLKDNFTGAVQWVNENAIYAFSVTDDPASFGAERFVLQFELDHLESDLAVNASNPSVCEGSIGAVVVENTQMGVQYALMINNVSVSESVIGNGSTLLIPFATDSLIGDQLITVIAQRESCDQLITLDNTVAITIISQPSITATESASACGNTSVQLNVIAENASLYRWYSDAEGLNLVAETTLGSFEIVNLTSNQTLYVSALNTNGCESGLQVIQAIIENAPLIESAVAEAICEGQKASVSLLADENAVLFNVYATIGANEPLFTSELSSFEVQADQSTTYYIAAVNESGCEGSRVAMVINVTALPEISSPALQQVCLGSDLTLELQAQNASSFEWFTDAELTDQLTNESATFIAENVSASSILYVRAINELGCAGEAVAVQIEAINLDTPIINEINTCSLNNIQLQAQGANEQESYRWYRNGELVNETTTGALVVTSFEENQEWTVTITNSLGCEGNASVISINYYPIEEPLVSEEYVNCEPQAFELSAIGAPEGAMYRWYSNLADVDPIFEGALFTTAVINNSTNFYVAIVNENGCESNRVEVPVVISEQAIINPVSPLTVCLGQSVDVQLNGSSVSEYRWFLDQDLSVTAGISGSRLLINDLTESRNYFVQPINAAGCAGEVIQINVIATELNAPVSAAVNTCSLNNINVQASGANDGERYQWYLNGSFYSETAAGQLTINNFNQDQTWSVAIVNASGCASESTSLTINYEAIEEAVISETYFSCEPTNFTINATGAHANSEYRWFTSLTSTTAIHTGATLITPKLDASSTYYVAIVNSNGCEGNRIPVELNVAATPSIQAVETMQVCQGDPVTINLISENALVLLWFKDEELTQFANFEGAQYHIESIQESVKYYVLPINAQNCDGKPIVVEIQVNAVSEVTVPSVQVCSTTKVEVTASGSQGGEMYAWFLNDRLIQTSVAGRFEIANYQASDKWEVGLMNALGCVGNLQPVVIEYAQLETPSVATNYAACEPSQFAIQASGASANAVYNWYTTASGGTPIWVGNSTFETGILQNTTTYYVSITNENGCEGERVQVVVAINNLTPVEISVENDRFLVSSYSTGNQWYMNGNLLEGQTNQKIEALESGEYSVIVNQNGCETSAYRQWLILGINDHLLKNVRVYPNPAVSSINIVSEELTLTKVMIYSMRGELVLEQTNTHLEKSMSINLDRLRTGAYMIRLESADAVRVVKLIKE